MNKLLPSLIENEVKITKDTYYTAIIGESPSSGARSPILWNKVFKDQKINCQMYPFDVAEKNLSSLIHYLNEDPYFLGGAVAVPFKSLVSFHLCCQVSKTSPEDYPPVNCIYRDRDNRLAGTNTDGEAAKVSLESNYGSIQDKKILILGGGGAGTAIARELSSITKVNLACRSTFPSTKQFGNLPVEMVKWKLLDKYLSVADILINCTSSGFMNDMGMPITNEQIKDLRKDCFIYDIIYQPLKTQLLEYTSKCGHTTLNGLEMNLKQAILSFSYVTRKILPELTQETIESTMTTK